MSVIYKTLSEIEHVKERKEMYLGESNCIIDKVFVFDIESNEFKQENITLENVPTTNNGDSTEGGQDSEPIATKSSSNPFGNGNCTKIPSTFSSSFNC